MHSAGTTLGKFGKDPAMPDHPRPIHESTYKTRSNHLVNNLKREQITSFATALPNIQNPKSKNPPFHPISYHPNTIERSPTHPPKSKTRKTPPKTSPDD
jgi:hypothetical protein